MGDIAALILAAGKGTRMKSGLVKVMHSLGGYPMIAWPVNAARAAGAARSVMVVGYQGEKVREYFAGAGDVAFAIQEEQLGTGHAVACAAPLFQGFKGSVLVLCGDVPLIRSATLQAMLSVHEARRATVTVLTAHPEDPFGYGRIVKGEGGKVLRIVEEKDATAEEKRIDEINTGIYCVEADFLFTAVAGLNKNNVQGEYYLTDIVKRGADQGKLCLSYAVADAAEVMGVNDRIQLAAAGKVLQRRINEKLMLAGVTIIDPDSAYIEEGVEIGMDTVIYPNVHIAGPSTIGSGCLVEPSVVIRRCTIGNGVTIKAGSVMTDSSRARLRCHRPDGPSPAGERAWGACQGRQLRGDQEGGDGGRVEGVAPDLSRRCHHRQQRQHRLRHHNLQLRRGQQAPYGNRG